MKNKFIILLLILSFLLLVGCNTPVASNITTIDIELDSIEIEVGEDFIIPINYDGKGDYSDLEFIIADESIISNDSNFITGNSEGITNLTVCSKQDKNIKDSVTIFVNPMGFEAEFVRIVTSSSSLNVGGTMSFYIGNLKSLNANGNEDFIFYVTDPTVLQLNDDYTVTALKEGVCTIQARQINAPGNLGEYTVYVGLQSNDKTNSGEPENTPLVAYFEDNNYTINCDTDEQIKILGAKDYQRYIYKSEDENILLISDT